ncbi:flagellar export chaperone FliS [Nitratidesulfovibrio sp. SRB-5]|uniref:flagellar export chaperone FliS n=1 Tax=Nitratidesulfovibrio sp. SRB-5 TaxID=2872636 RepID=UPI001025A32D|nr:flagellar export chaperone FliS [Nitratidesulfovibrio sp. SRB-5]MBZ2171085.1 flagellar export chaperone FliS [Nitratidesulfovibrio sp. SRB-5]RXF75852.1 flagellar export chaperone FliS [Desulfovibrio sp. DS-1]
MQKAAHAYLQTQVTTTTQGELLLLLYDGAIKFLNQAKEKIAERDYAGKGILISKALDIVNELDASLNLEKGGELAENLHKLYFYCSTRLLNANLKMDVTFIDEVIKILSGLRGAYGQIVNTPEAMAVGASMAASRTPANAAPSRVPLPTAQMPPLGKPAQFGRAHAQAYGQQAPAADAAPQAVAQALPPLPSPPEQAEQAVQTAQTAAPVSTAPSAQQAAPTSAGMPPTAPATATGEPAAPTAAETSEASDTQPVKGFAPSRMAAASLYRKFAQG